MSAYMHSVALMGGVSMAQAEHVILLEEASLHPHGVQGRGRMALKNKDLDFRTIHYLYNCWPF